MTVTLTKISARNYRNIDLNDGFALNPLTVFIGANGSGKSNLVSLLRFLKGCLAKDQDYSQETTAFESSWYNVLGGVQAINASANLPNSLIFQYDFFSSYIMRGLQYRIDVTINQPSVYLVSREHLIYGDMDNKTDDAFVYYSLHYPALGRGVLSIDQEDGEGMRSHEIENVPTNNLGLLTLPSLLERSVNPPSLNSPVFQVRRDLLETINQWQFYNSNNMNLQKIRESEPRIGSSDSIHLSVSGENLPLVLDNLFQQDFRWEEELNLACRAILPGTRKVRPARVGRFALTIEWYMEGMERPFHLSDMSDGTVRMLCWAVLLKAPKLPPLLVIDEPEVGLHVAWMPLLAEWIKHASRRTQVIIITHSSDLLDHFSDTLDAVHCFERENNHFIIKPLNKAWLAEKLDRQGWQLGDLYRLGDPAVGGWPW